MTRRRALDQFGRWALALGLLLSLGCHRSDTQPPKSIAGFFQLGVDVPGMDECASCVQLDLEDLAGSHQLHRLDTADATRLGSADVASLDLMLHRGLSRSGDAWSALVTLTPRGRERLNAYAGSHPGPILVTAGSDLLVSVIEPGQGEARGRSTLVFFLPTEAIRSAFLERVRPDDPRVQSADDQDAIEACRTVARGRADLLETCLELVERQRSSRK